ncbi:ComF family protein [Pontibacter arcticus]|uniref:ComF family protein n=1 Tax=Pontibacter arcticus TaxID=2080288 RepID=UPI00140348F8|nr:ComF family protein [Pontibacter arcticus]
MFEDLLALLFPETCYGCDKALGKGEKCICTDCSIKLPYTNFHQNDLHELNPLERRFWGKVPVKYAFSYLHFESKGRVQRLLHRLKYKGAQDLGEHIGKQYGYQLAEHKYNLQFDLIVPVPLHKIKLRKRGYNQSDCFATGLAEAMQLPWNAKALARTTYTSTQTSKTRFDRWQNVEQVFMVNLPDEVKDKRVLLVDDVLTTGATLEACAVALLDAGAAEVSIATIAAA